MPSRTVFERSLFAVLLGGAAIAAAPVARADDKQVCSAAYDQTQTLRRAGKLQAAREQAAACMRDACAQFIRTDCAKWLGEIDASQPTVVFEVRDREGRETSAVRVTLDGQAWFTAIDGKAKAIDPGAHALKYEIDGAAAIEETVQIREGEKNRKLTASFAPTAARDAKIGRPPSPGGEAQSFDRLKDSRFYLSLDVGGGYTRIMGGGSKATSVSSGGGSSVSSVSSSEFSTGAGVFGIHAAAAYPLSRAVAFGGALALFPTTEGIGGFLGPYAVLYPVADGGFNTSLLVGFGGQGGDSYGGFGPGVSASAAYDFMDHHGAHVSPTFRFLYQAMFGSETYHSIAVTLGVGINYH